MARYKNKSSDGKNWRSENSPSEKYLYRRKVSIRVQIFSRAIVRSRIPEPASITLTIFSLKWHSTCFPYEIFHSSRWWTFFRFESFSFYYNGVWKVGNSGNQSSWSAMWLSQLAFQLTSEKITPYNRKFHQKLPSSLVIKLRNFEQRIVPRIAFIGVRFR